VLEQLKEERRKYIESLNENVQNAIKIAESKGHSTDFTNKLVALNEKIAVYKQSFYNKKPKFVQSMVKKDKKEEKKAKKRLSIAQAEE